MVYRGKGKHDETKISSSSDVTSRAEQFQWTENICLFVSCRFKVVNKMVAYEKANFTRSDNKEDLATLGISLDYNI